MQTLKTPAGERLIVLTEAEYEDLTDLRDSHQVVADLKAGRTEAYSEEEVDAFLAAPTPLAYWRQKRHVAADSLARAAGITPQELAEMEAGTRTADVLVYARLARRLHATIDDVAPIERDDLPATAAAAE